MQQCKHNSVKADQGPIYKMYSATDARAGDMCPPNAHQIGQCSFEEEEVEGEEAEDSEGQRAGGKSQRTWPTVSECPP